MPGWHLLQSLRQLESDIAPSFFVGGADACYGSKIMVPVWTLLFQIAGVANGGDSACPSTSEVRELVVDERVRNAEFQIEDLGPQFVVRTRAGSRLLEEPTHDCVARTKMAAFVLTAMLAPPQVEDHTSARDATPRTTAPRDAPPLVTWIVGLGPAVEFAPGFGERDSVATLGGSLRAGFTTAMHGNGNGGGATFGASLFAPASFQVGPNPVQIIRGTLDLSGHGQVGIGPLSLRGALGPALELHDVRGTAPGGVGHFRTLAGIRVASELVVPLSETWATAVEVSALLLPGPAQLAFHSTNTIGTEPAVYLGASIKIWFAP